MLNCTLSQHIIEDHRVIKLENHDLIVSIDVDRGAHIFEFIDRRTGINMLYKDPKGFAHHDVGGWYELFPNAGKQCIYNSIPIPNHGDVRNIAWHYNVVQETEKEIALQFETISQVLPFKLEKVITIRKGNSSLWVAERIVNIGDEALPYLWGHHVTFGFPFVDEHCRIDLPKCRVYKTADYGNEASRLIVEATGTLQEMPGKGGELLDLTYFPVEPCSEMLFIDGLSEHWYNLYNEKLELGCALSWDKSAFPGLWLWQENEAAMQAPFYGKTRGMALEPQSSNVPILSRAVNMNAAPILEPSQSRESYLTMTLHHLSSRVVHVDRDGLLQYA